MNNLTLEDFMNNSDKLFKTITGLDPHNYTNEEWQEWYHNAIKLEAETNEYTREILRTAEDIIKNKDYSMIIHILKNYDYYVKLAQGTTELNYPFWCYCFGRNPESNQEE